ncbi:hypothetical protein C8R47DRAFT_1158155 [Mycena vitilis]|nr:hypothetical protein C8R47DRAFT_1158155 [Mycena vitilis]
MSANVRSSECGAGNGLLSLWVALLISCTPGRRAPGVEINDYLTAHTKPGMLEVGLRCRACDHGRAHLLPKLHICRGPRRW